MDDILEKLEDKLDIMYNNYKRLLFADGFTDFLNPNLLSANQEIVNIAKAICDYKKLLISLGAIPSRPRQAREPR